MEDLDPMTQYLIAEELGYADAGLAISLGVSAMPFFMAAAMAPFFPQKKFLGEMVSRYVEEGNDRLIGCWAITEPDHGTDWSLGGDDPKCGPSVKAILKGDEYTIHGQKSAWVTNGPTATHAVLHVGLDQEKGMKGQGLALIPLDLPGITRGKPLDKIGQRPLSQGEIFFDDVRVPMDYMVMTPSLREALGMDDLLAERSLAEVNGGMAAVFAGLAKAAFDEAFSYAKVRIQGGVPIIEHQAIKLKLFKMFTMVEAARASARRMAMYNATATRPSGPHAVACKCLSTETAFQVASEAIQIFGGNGLSREYPIEKMLRDARASMIEDGVNEALSLTAMKWL
jgi:alkylation response protein AidB-like acyl-CoA dehydrogenase